jgi:hypothetical protein
MAALIPCRTAGCPHHGLYADGTDPAGAPLNICPDCRNARNRRAIERAERRAVRDAAAAVLATIDRLYAERADLQSGRLAVTAEEDAAALAARLAVVEAEIARLYAAVHERRDAMWAEVERANAGTRISDRDFAAMLAALDADPDS